MLHQLSHNHHLRRGGNIAAKITMVLVVAEYADDYNDTCIKEYHVRVRERIKRLRAV